MDIPLTARAEHLNEKRLRSGPYSALEPLDQNEQTLAQGDERRKAVKHGLTLGTGLRIRDLIHEGHKYRSERVPP